VEKVIYDKIRLGEPDSSGRQSPKIIQGAHKDLPADLVIKALGFDPEDIPHLFSEPKLEVSIFLPTNLRHLHLQNHHKP
ncbi:MAG: hypothetical protein ACO36I_14415, partial [Candidatus Latescibacterota bacterium]